MTTRFTWDPRKSSGNLRTHGISFEMAREVFPDPHHLVAENYAYKGDGEQRQLAIGWPWG